ncbi:MAG TPA: hypothetical protein VM577_14110 [Anaerovoracaceae bacterium]|nr:hypothetical protein [Anaerovoracaceae bacterium]
MLSLPAISEEDIRASLLKGNLYDKLRDGEIQVISSDINLLQFNSEQKTFLEAHGITSVSEIDNTVVGSATGFIDTVAGLAALVGPTTTQTQSIYVRETGAYYSFIANDVTTVDNWIVISPTGGVAGRWKLVGTEINISPIGGTSDDWNRLFGIGGAAVAAAAAGVKVILKQGAWLCKTVQQVPRNLVLECAPGVVINASLVSTGGAGHLNSVFSFDQFTTPLGTTTLASAATVGSNTLSVNSLMGLSTVGSLVGAEILIQDEDPNHINQTAAFVIRAASGSGPYSLTLDRPLLRTWPSSGNGTNVYRGPRAKGIKLIGNGATITGTGDRAISLISAWDCYACDWILDGPGFDSEYTCSFDTGSFQSGYERIRVLSSHATGLALEGCEGCWMADCHVEFKSSDRTNAGILTQAAYNTEIRGCHVSGRTGASGAGLLIGWILDDVASRGVRVIGGSYNGNLIGIDVRGGSNDIEIIGVDCSHNTSNGLRVLAESGPTRNPGRVHIKGGLFRRNGGVGILVDGSKGVRLDNGVFLEENTLGGAATQNGGELRVHGADSVSSIAAVAHFKANSSNDILVVESSRLSGTPTGFPYGVWNAGGNATVKGIKFDPAMGDQTLTGIVQTGGSLYVEDIESVGVLQTNGITATAGTIRRGPKTNFANFSAPYNLSGSAQPSFGIVTLNGTSPVTFNFTDIKAQDRPFARRSVSAGTPGHYTVAVSAGVGVVVTGSASDTSTIEIDIL